VDRDHPARNEAQPMTEGMLKRGQVLIARNMQFSAVIEDTLGEGARAEVYRARIGNATYALKWYRPEYLAGDPKLWERLKVAINSEPPTEQFLWPFDLVSHPRSDTFGGYLMPIRSPEFINLADLMRLQTEPSFHVRSNVGFSLAQSFFKLHAAGLCYRDINFRNVFFNPDTGDIRMGDTDNVDVILAPGSIKGTPGFMAPEVANGVVEPNAASDRFALAVLLFFIFVMGHPLKGERELTLPYDAADPDQWHRLCALDPVFIFDPHNESNRPQPGVHDNPLRFWPIYPASLRKLFTRAFTLGLYDPDARVMENEWRKEMCALRDAIFYCPSCGAENFFDLERVRQKKALGPCRGCHLALDNPPRMRLGAANGSQLVTLRRGTQLFAHHLEGDMYNFANPLAEVVINPLGLKNLSPAKWTSRGQDGLVTEVQANEVLPLPADCRINFGKTEGQVRLS
jgi:DNA-binding helix-hairpin-helix protein with protein kinase domain